MARRVAPQAYAWVMPYAAFRDSLYRPGQSVAIGRPVRTLMRVATRRLDWRPWITSPTVLRASRSSWASRVLLYPF